jgi:hypothetical protein
MRLLQSLENRETNLMPFTTGFVVNSHSQEDHVIAYRSMLLCEIPSFL